jgi:outer membrane protein assembly factor BamE
MVTIRSIHVKSGVGRPRAALLLSLALMMAGCSNVTDYLPKLLRPYRPDIQQGNVITSDMVEQLRPGMTRDQVKFMLGTPLLADAFHSDRWDYLYYLNPRVGAPQRRNLVIYFKDSRLDHFTSDPMPPESMADNLILGRKTPPAPGTASKAPDAKAASPAEPPKEPAPETTPPESEPPKESPPPATPPAPSQ